MARNHYLALIEQKANALDQAAPLADWKLPEEFATLRRLLEARMSKSGKREFVQVLRLMEVFKIDDVAADFAAAGRSNSAAGTQARGRYRGPSCLSRFIPEGQRPTAVLIGLGVTGTWSERA